MAYIMTTEAEIEQKAGANASIGFDTTMMTASNLRAESTINCICRYNFSDNYSTLNDDVKLILNDFCSSFVALEKINYDMSVFTDNIEAEDMINVIRDGMLRAIGILKDQKVVTFINGA